MLLFFNVNKARKIMSVQCGSPTAVKSEVISRRRRHTVFCKIKSKTGFSYFSLVTSFACYISLNAKVICSSETFDCVPSYTALRTQKNVLFMLYAKLSL
jgi:hypothetical protein